jgi:hypothetical protein
LAAVPRAGGRARTLLSLKRARPSIDAVTPLSASAERVAVIVEVDHPLGHTVEWRVYSGPPAGPLALVRRTPVAAGRSWARRCATAASAPAAAATPS